MRIRPPETPAGGVVCLDAASGAEHWSFAANDAVIQQPVVVGDRVYFGSRDGHVYCLRLRDGAKLFAVPLGAPVMSAPAVADGRVYAVSQAGRFRCLDATDGTEVWEYDFRAATRTEPRFFAQVRVTGGRVYVAGEFRSDPDAAGFACLYCLPLDPGRG